MIGLCANCICTHTQIHVQKGTSPDYENIRTTYKKAQESIHGQVQQFEEHKERIVNLFVILGCNKWESSRKERES